MPHVRLKGLEKSVKRLKEGRRVTYWYAWRGGPRLPGRPGEPSFMAAYNAAVADRRTPSAETLAGLVGRYRASPEYAALADATRKEWSGWLDRIAADISAKDIGGLTFRLLDDRRVKSDILDWRDQWGSTPRKADYSIQVLRRTLAFGVSRGLLASNAAEGVAALYASDRADQIWTPAEIIRYGAVAPSPEVSFIVRLACLTGLRRADLTRVAWSHVGPSAIVMPTGKSRGRRNQIIPLLSETRALLEEIRSHQAARQVALAERAAKLRRPAPPLPTTILSNTRGQPWSPNGLEHQVVDAKSAAGIDKHLHDARGTFGTRLRQAGLSAPEIADVLGWAEDRVERLLATYVDQETIVLALARRIEQNEKRPKSSGKSPENARSPRARHPK